MKVSVEGLPKGMSFNRKTRMIKGKTEGPGDYPIAVNVENQYGSDQKSFILKVGDKLALTPPMGWNSWNAGEVPSMKSTFVRQAMLLSGQDDRSWWTYICLMNLRRKTDPETLRLGSNEKFSEHEETWGTICLPGLKFGSITDVVIKPSGM